MKKSYALFIMILIGVIFSAQFLYAQQKNIDKGNKYFEQFEFQKAIEQYKAALEKDESLTEPKIQLANIYRLLNDPVEAGYWYSQFVDLPVATPIDKFHYAQMLHSNSKYELARKYYLEYARLAPDDLRGRKLASACANVEQFKRDSLKYAISNVRVINSEYSDYSPAFYKNKSLAFPSQRQPGQIDIGVKTDVWSGAPFTDIYLAERDEQGNFKEPILLPGKPNQKFHEGPLTFTADFQEMYFTRNNYYGKKKRKSSEGIMKLKVFHSYYKDGKWVGLDELPFNSDEYSVGHPSLSKDGKYLYFASDMPGSLGGQDIWVSEWKDSVWSDPVNLGDQINTKGDEVFPYIHSDGTLYFASDGHPGLGGLDIFSATKTNGKWGNVKNLGYPINTNADDFGLIMDEDNKGGFFSSNRPAGIGSDDIYQFTVAALMLKGIVYDKNTEEPIPVAKVVIKQKETIYDEIYTDNEGRFVVPVDPDAVYTFEASKAGYHPNTMNISTTGLTNESPEVRIPLTPLTPVAPGALVLAGKVLEKETGIPLPGSTVKLTNDLTGETRTITAGPSGEFSFNLDPENQYTLTAEKNLYFLDNPEKVSTTGMTAGTINRNLELTKLEAGAVIQLHNIYYDLDKWDIRPDAAKELDRIVELMKKYPQLTIATRSHCDSRASYTYNMWLSAKRAESSANYIISRGIDPNRIHASGFGEYLLVNECSDNVPCSEEKHQLNRRTEFKVLTSPEGVIIKGSVE